MIEKLREFFASGAGKATAGGIVLIGLVFAYFSLKSATTSDGEEMSANRMFVDATTGKPFGYRLDITSRIPVPAPSGKDTGYPAEACYWTKDGKIKTDPTWVLINEWRGSKEPTFCPDCGRLVVGHNPAPRPDASPPPTKAEYGKR